MRTYQYRLYPNREQRRRLDACLDQSRQLYNEMLGCEKQHYQETGKFLSKYDLTARFKGRGGAYLPASTVRMPCRSAEQSVESVSGPSRRGLGLPALQER
jgi:transposase